MSQFPSSPVTRRDLLAASAAGLALAALPTAPASARGPGLAMVERAEALLGQLDPPQRDRARFPFDGSTRRRWNFMGPWAKPGLPLEAMTEAQKVQAMDLLATGLSPAGVAKAEKVMVLQDVLREMGQGPRDRSRERFSVAIFGDPSPTQPWGWRFEGHHLSLSFTLVGGEVVAVTPSSFSSNPNVVSTGPQGGMVALVEEEALARRLYGDLSPRHRDQALIRDRAFGNILTTAGRENRLGSERAGLPLADLPTAQREGLLRLVEVYAVDHLVPPLATAQTERLGAADPMATHFAWAGGDGPGEMIYYRLHGDTYLIEFASLPNQPLHLHTVYHDLARNLGAHRLG